MAYNESSYEASKKYKANKIKRVPLDMQISDYEALQEAAFAAGEKVNTYIKGAISQRIERDKRQQAGGGSGFSGDLTSGK